MFRIFEEKMLSIIQAGLFYLHIILVKIWKNYITFIEIT